jgi:NitT/TauT family transport system permease protein
MTNVVAALVSPRGRALPVVTIVAAIIVLWYALAVFLNWPQVTAMMANNNPTTPPTTSEIVSATWAMERPVLPAPHQVIAEFWKTTIDTAPTSKRSLVYHARITASATLLGFFLGAILGMLLAVGIVHNRTLDRSLMPWIIASQTIPILALAPMIVVILGNVSIVPLMPDWLMPTYNYLAQRAPEWTKNLAPKAVISMYLCFFPVAIGMVKGLRSPDLLQIDLMRTYSAGAWAVFWKLRLPASLPFLFASMKVAVAISLVGTIVGELPTGASGGIGARLLSGSYYGQTVQIWSALFMAAILGSVLVYAMSGIERLTLRRMGTRA